MFDGTTGREPTEPEGYSEATITARMEMLQAFDDAWDVWFDTQGIRPLRLSYEDLSDNPQQALGKALRYIGQDANLARDGTPGLRKLSDAVNAEWIARYRASRSAP
ncbi:MAG: Stf0 family sulfotransferase [Planktotalea sp.]|uniref:Stf0 family sulfotransferase n=1 Tax=Planktotalea sp. TaxID=2029877 RepID=UPI003C7168D0